MKVIMEVTYGMRPNSFDISTLDGKTIVDNWLIPDWKPEAIDEPGIIKPVEISISSKIQEAILLKERGFSDATILEILKG